MMTLSDAVRLCPLIAILRGVHPNEVGDIGATLIDSGFAIIEVPLNSPSPFESIEALAAAFGDRALIGAGTVLTAAEADQAVDAGARLLLAPNFDSDVVWAARERGIEMMPGVATMSEAFAALSAGAAALKLFPARELGAGTVSAWRAVLPAETLVFAVGGIDDNNLTPFLDAGVAGFGLGSSLYRPGDDATTVARAAERAIAAWRGAEAKRKVR